MIAEEKHKDALYALNAVLVRARTMAFDRVSHQTLAQVLDVAELLPMLLAEKRDRTVDFREQLDALVQIDPGFGVALQRFDGDHGLP